MVNLTINSNLLLLITIGVVLFIIIMAIIVIFRDKKKEEQEIDELLTDLRKDRKEKEVINELEKELNKEEKLEQEVKQIEVEDKSDFKEKKSEIEEVLKKMQKDLDKQPKEVVANFENEQEEKAIISYQELVENINEKSSKVEVIDDELDYRKDKKRSENLIDAIENVENNKTNDLLTNSNNSKEVSESVKKFKNTEFISPIYGKMEEHLKYPTVPSFDKEDDQYIDLEDKNINSYLEDFDFKSNMEIDTLEKTLNMPPISKELKKNDEFLQALKEFRKKLD